MSRKGRPHPLGNRGSRGGSSCSGSSCSYWPDAVRQGGLLAALSRGRTGGSYLHHSPRTAQVPMVFEPERLRKGCRGSRVCDRYARRMRARRAFATARLPALGTEPLAAAEPLSSARTSGQERPSVRAPMGPRTTAGRCPMTRCSYLRLRPGDLDRLVVCLRRSCGGLGGSRQRSLYLIMWKSRWRSQARIASASRKLQDERPPAGV
jgi:hypothetical protein